MPTPKQAKLIKLLKENIGSMDSTLTMGDLLLKAGYTPATAKNAYLIFDSKAIKEATGDIAKMLDDKRKMAITQITEQKLKDAPARELAYVVDVLTKNMQLLTGKSTNNVGVVIEISEILARKYQTLDISTPSGSKS